METETEMEMDMDMDMDMDIDIGKTQAREMSGRLWRRKRASQRERQSEAFANAN